MKKKFRVWDDKRQLFYVPDGAGLMYCQSEFGYPQLLQEFQNCGAWDIDGGAIQQFVGLKDCNNTEIYEGDIVECYFNMRQDVKNVGLVEFCEKYGHFGIRITEDNIFVPAREISKPFSNFITNDGKLKIKVIGNIFQ